MEMSDDEYITEVLGIYSSQTEKDINTIIEETLLEKAICLGPYVYAVETLKMMNSANAAIARLKSLGVTTNLEALTNLNNRYKAALAEAAPWIFRGELPHASEDAPAANEKSVSESIDDLIRRIANGELRKQKRDDEGYDAGHDDDGDLE